MYLARVLGAEGFGKYGFVTTISAYASLFSNFGIDQYAAQRLSLGSIEQKETFVQHVLITRFGLSLFFAALFILLGYSYAATEIEFSLFAFQAITILALSLNLQFYFIAEKKTITIALIKTLISLGILLFTLLFVSGYIDLPKVTLIHGVVTLIVYFVAVLYFFPVWRERIWLPSIHRMIEILRSAAPLGIAMFMVQIYYSADIVFLGFTNPGVELGYYTGAYKIILILTIIPPLVYMAFLPELSKIQAHHFQNRVTVLYIRVLILCGVIVSVLFFIFATQIIVLVLGGEYLPATGVFRILLVNVFLVFVNVALAHLFIAWNQHKKYFVIVSSGAVANILANVVLIPLYGIYGAAVATVIAEGAVCVVALCYHHSLFGLMSREKM